MENLIEKSYQQYIVHNVDNTHNIMGKNIKMWITLKNFIYRG